MCIASCIPSPQDGFAIITAFRKCCGELCQQRHFTLSRLDGLGLSGTALSALGGRPLRAPAVSPLSRYSVAAFSAFGGQPRRGFFGFLRIGGLRCFSGGCRLWRFGGFPPFRLRRAVCLSFISSLICQRTPPHHRARAGQARSVPAGAQTLQHAIVPGVVIGSAACSGAVIGSAASGGNILHQGQYSIFHQGKTRSPFSLKLHKFEP